MNKGSVRFFGGISMRRWNIAIGGVCVWLALAASPLWGQGNEESWIPSSGQFEALEKGQDCSVYRAVARKAKLSRQDLERRIQEEKDILRARYDAVQTCARSKLKGQSPSQLDDSVVAELCPSDYRAWIAPVYRLKMLQQDVDQTNRDLESIGGLVADYCKRLPRETLNGEF